MKYLKSDVLEKAVSMALADMAVRISFRQDTQRLIVNGVAFTRRSSRWYLPVDSSLAVYVGKNNSKKMTELFLAHSAKRILEEAEIVIEKACLALVSAEHFLSLPKDVSI